MKGEKSSKVRRYVKKKGQWHPLMAMYVCDEVIEI